MANLSSALMRAIGNEIIPAGESALANSATSALSEIGSKLGAGLATKAGSNMATHGVLNSLVPIRNNWAGEGDIEGMLNGKFLGTNQNYFDNTFSRGALDRATYGADQPIDQRKVAGLVRAIKNNEDIAPIAGFKNDDGLIDIFDGHHRLAAYQKAGKIPRVKLFTEDTKSQAYNYADEWARNAGKEVEQYIGKSNNDLPMSINENGGVSYDLSSLN